MCCSLRYSIPADHLTAASSVWFQRATHHFGKEPEREPGHEYTQSHVCETLLVGDVEGAHRLGLRHEEEWSGEHHFMLYPN